MVRQILFSLNRRKAERYERIIAPISERVKHKFLVRGMYENYAKLRDERGLSDYAIAKELGIGRSTFSEWKKGDYTPKIDKLRKIAAYFGVTTDELQGDKEAVETDRATLKLWKYIADKPLMEVLEMYSSLSPEKKKRAVEGFRLFCTE